MKNIMIIGVMCMLLLSACGGSTPTTAPTEAPPTAVPEVEDTPTEEPTDTPTIEPTPVIYVLKVNVEPADGGNVSLVEGQFEEGSEVDVFAEPSIGFIFDSWSGDDTSQVYRIRVMMDSDKTISAHFVRAPSMVRFAPSLNIIDPSQLANALIDFDSDGDLDLIFTASRLYPQNPAPVLAFRNNGSGKLIYDIDIFAGYPVETTQASDWAVADFNGDGLDDLFIADRGKDYPGTPQGGQSRLLMQIETGQLIDETKLRLPQQKANTYDITTGDIDADGDVDIYMCNASHNTNPSFYINDGSGYFTEDLERIPRSITYRANEYRSSLLVDVDNDEDLDLVLGAARSLYYDTILINDGSGVFTLAPQTVLPVRMGGINAQTNAISAADFDQDGWLDLVMATNVDRQVANLQILFNNGDGTFRDETSRLEQDWDSYLVSDCGTGYQDLIVRTHIVDANNDGWPDILAQGGACIMHLLFENNNGEIFTLKENYSDYRLGPLPQSLVPGDMNNDGVLDVVLLYNMHHQVLLRVPPADLLYGQEPVVWDMSPEEFPPTPDITCIDETSMAESNPDAVADFLYQDDFEGALAPGWNWIREEVDRWNLDENPGYLRITLEPEYYLRNLLLRQPPEGDFEISTRVLFRPTSNYQFAGLLIYQDDETRVEFGRAYCLGNNPDLCPGNALFFMNRIQNELGCPSFPTITDSTSEVYLKIRREGNLYSAYYSEDGVDWVLVGQHVTELDPMFIGLRSGNSSETANADFDYFLIETIP